MNDRKSQRRGRRGMSVASPDPNPVPDLGVGGEIINILIVDDEPKNLTVLETILDDPSYRLVRAQSAEEALLALVAQEFALLILDIRMPGMTGFELAQMVKARKKTALVPIIFLTAYYNDDQHVLEGYGSGAVDYLHKPVNAPILRSKVAVFAELHRRSRETERANRILLAEVAERSKAQEQLRELNETLEERVAERTQVLLSTSNALSETDERYRSLFENSLDAIVSLSTEGRFQAANRAALNLTGRSLTDLRTMHFRDLCAPDQRDAAESAFRAAFHRDCTTIDTAIITASGDRRELLISGTPALVGDKVIGLSCIARDITARKRVENDLKVAKLAAEKANMAKSEFLSRMSHELRTPLNAILGFAQIIGSEMPSTSSHKQSINEILNAGWYLLNLINEILDLAQIESGKLALAVEPTALTEVIRECLGMIEPQAQKRGIKVSCPSMETAYFVEADRVRLKQAIINLLSNAIKYNRSEGTVIVDCRPSVAGRVRVSIADSGAGLTADQLIQLCQPFNRLGREASAEEGTGIGLVVTKQLVELMGGAIGVESTVGTGSIFWIELNLTEDTEESAQPSAFDSALPVRNDAPVRTLLYVEDNPANLRLVGNLIQRRSDLRLLSAKDGQRGIEIARDSRPDVILIDINLPGINGFEVLKMLRADPATAHIPLVAISANAMPQDIEKGLQAGFFRYLTKPIKINEFMNTLNMVLKFSESPPTSAPKKGNA